ncbi:MAG: DUF5058 family protein [Clostridia bacterium]|nr:DUF5058 family protein [Clostridia bacterium]
MEFSVNHWIIYLIVALIICAVTAQAVFFMIRALKRAKKINMPKEKIKKAILSSVIFTIAPAISIIVCVMTLSHSLGIPLPWYRLSVVGSLSYETIAAQNALSGMGMTLGSGTALNASQFVTILLVMTISIMAGMLLVPLIGKKLQKGMISLGNKDKNWRDIFQNSLFIGMISAFLGFVFCDFSAVFSGGTWALVPVLVMLSSAVMMLICGLLRSITKWRWINDYALPISMIFGMAMAIPLTSWLGTMPVAQAVTAVACLF